MAKILENVHTPEREHQIALFYVERVLEQSEAGSILLAQKNFNRYQDCFEAILSPENFKYLVSQVQVEDDWSRQKENQWIERLQNANDFGEHKIVHDIAHEILLHHDHPADKCPTHSICDEVNDILANNNMEYLDPDDVTINTFLNATVSFLVDKRRSSSSGQDLLKGNPGFYIRDTLGRRCRCFIKQVANAQIGDHLKLKITNIPGFALTAGDSSEPIIYVEPRVSPGDVIEVELVSLSYTGNSFTFRHHSYDGFLWFKRRGVNKEIFNQNTLRPKDRIRAKVLYTTEEEKHSKGGNLTRLGIIKAIPLMRAGMESNPEADPDNYAARVLS